MIEKVKEDYQFGKMRPKRRSTKIISDLLVLSIPPWLLFIFEAFCVYSPASILSSVPLLSISSRVCKMDQDSYIRQIEGALKNAVSFVIREVLSQPKAPPKTDESNFDEEIENAKTSIQSMESVFDTMKNQLAEMEAARAEGPAAIADWRQRRKFKVPEEFTSAPSPRPTRGPLSQLEYQRYGRQMIMPEIGLEGGFALSNVWSSDSRAD